MKAPHRCPVCLGAGQVDRSLYESGDSTAVDPRFSCRSCSGSGVVWALLPSVPAVAPTCSSAFVGGIEQAMRASGLGECWTGETRPTDQAMQDAARPQCFGPGLSGWRA